MNNGIGKKVNGNIEISVLLVTYNHEKYAKQAMDSILMQKVDCNYEIVVVDDCSTDDTLRIIEQYKKLYPKKIRILKSKKNLGITKNYKRGFKVCRGKYIAVLEGDDYWIIDNKLQMQWQFLKNHSDYALVFNMNKIKNEITNEETIPWFDEQCKTYMTFDAETLAIGNFIGNFSICMYRGDYVRKIKDSIYDMVTYDWIFNLAVAQYGLIGYLPQVASVYRISKKSSWNSKSAEERIIITLNALDGYNKFFNYKYNKQFTDQKIELSNQLAEILKNKGVKNE